MASLNEIAYNLKNIAYGGSATTKEESIGIRQIKFWVHYYRAEILKDIIRDGKGIPLEFFQNLNLDSTYDFQASIPEWQAYIDANTDSSREALVFSDRAITEAGISLANSSNIWSEDYYGRDFNNRYTREEKADYGRITFSLPDIINIDGYGVKNLQLRRGQTTLNQNHGVIDVPVVSQNEYLNKKYNRFNSKSPSSFITRFANQKLVLIVGELKSHLRGAGSGNYLSPIQYVFYSDMLLSDPTKHPRWKDFGGDDSEYPISQNYITDLNERILAKEMQTTLNTIDDRIDDERDSTKFVQSQAQRQVRNSS
jgi:hypothetical protein